MVDLADGITYMNAANEAMRNDGIATKYTEDQIRNTIAGKDPYLYPNVDWLKEIFNDWGHNRRVNVNVRGGSEKVAYYASVGMVLVRGIPHISWNFLSTTASVLKKTDGILPAILNTLYVIVLTLLIVLPLGVGAAVYLTEYASNRRLIEVIEFTNETLAGIPSIIYGLVGMLVFSQALGFQTCLLSGSLTLVVMNLPTIIRTTQESLKTVPQGYREGAMGLGAGKWHIIRTIVLPCSIDGIVTGCILAVGRIVGESAALLFTAGAAEVIAKSVFKAYTSNGATLSVLLYLRAFEDGDFTSAWGIGAVLLVLVLLINLAARLAKTKLKQKQ